MQHDRPDTADQRDQVIAKNTSEGNDLGNAENPTGKDTWEPTTQSSLPHPASLQPSATLHASADSETLLG